jgi:MtN3 and saliva related transmembrane protein
MENIILGIGLAGGFGTTISFFPQVLKAYKTKHTVDLSLPMIILQLIGIVCWFVYGIFKSDIPIIAANAVALCSMTALFYLKLKFG